MGAQVAEALGVIHRAGTSYVSVCSGTSYVSVCSGTSSVSVCAMGVIHRAGTYDKLVISVCFLIRKRMLSRSMFAGFVYRDVKPENILRCSRYLIRKRMLSNTSAYVSVCCIIR